MLLYSVQLYCLGLEIMGPAYRTMAGMMLCLVFAFALVVLAGEKKNIFSLKQLYSDNTFSVRIPNA